MARTAVYSDVDIGFTQQTDGDIKRVVEIDAIKNSLNNIVSTMQGSRRMIPEFAILLHEVLFDPMDEDTARIIGERILEGIEFWDDRIEITGIKIEPKYDINEYRINLSFKIKQTNIIELSNRLKNYKKTFFSLNFFEPGKLERYFSEIDECFWEKIFYIGIPIQSTSDRLVKLMNRDYLVSDIVRIAQKKKKKNEEKTN